MRYVTMFALLCFNVICVGGAMKLLGHDVGDKVAAVGMAGVIICLVLLSWVILADLWRES